MEAIPSRVVPQADKLKDVIRAVEAVNAGRTSFQAIAKYIGKVERQGRYYRLAAEGIGLLANQQNVASLTPAGMEFLAASQTKRQRILEEQVLANPVFRESLLFIAGSGGQGVSRNDLIKYLVPRVDMEEGVVRRRVATIIGWLEELKLITHKGERIIARRVPGAAAAQPVADPTSNVFVPTKKLRPYEKKLAGTTEKGSISLKPIQYTVDSALQERASAEHKRIVHLLAERLRNKGALPYTNNTDLAVEAGAARLIFEIKTVTPANVHGQVRAAVAQLLEYRYLYDSPNAHLIVALSEKPPKSHAWLVDFLIDSGFLVCWATDSSLDCPAPCEPQIGQFMG